MAKKIDNTDETLKGFYRSVEKTVKDITKQLNDHTVDLTAEEGSTYTDNVLKILKEGINFVKLLRELRTEVFVKEGKSEDMSAEAMVKKMNE